VLTKEEKLKDLDERRARRKADMLKSDLEVSFQVHGDWYWITGLSPQVFQITECCRSPRTPEIGLA